MIKYNSAMDCKLPSGVDQIGKYPTLRYFQECHNYASSEEHAIQIDLSTFDQSGPAQYAFDKETLVLPWGPPPPPPDIAPIGYCPIPSGFALHALSYLYLNDNVICHTTSPLCKAMAGTRGSLGVSAYADQLWSPSIRLRSNARVEQLFTDHIDDRQDGASWGTLGAYKEPKFSVPDMPELQTGSSSATIESGKTATVKAGRYGDYVVRGQGTLRLQGNGPFSFKSLRVESGGFLEIIHGDGTTEVYTKSFLFRGQVKNADAARFLVGVIGSGTIYVDYGFTGSIWAPWNFLVLGQTNNQPFRGTYMAQTVTVHQKSVIEPVSFTKNLRCTP